MKFKSGKVVAVGEAMIEMAPVGGGHYRRGFAGDTFNTAWHMAQVLGGKASVGFVTKVGQDKMSNAFVSELVQDGLDVSAIGLDPDRTMGIYLIELEGVERSFHYWRKDSAASMLADDQGWLESAINRANLIHLSGITVAILSPDARDRLLAALAQARSNGARVSFDPNIRAKLWSSLDDLLATIPRFLEVTDIALPSFDDEKAHWGDVSPDATIRRFTTAGVAEVVVKNGVGPVSAISDGHEFVVDTPTASGIRDTSGAGDAFNAGYLAARLLGKDPATAVVWGQKISREVIRHFGARIPKDEIPEISLRDD